MSSIESPGEKHPWPTLELGFALPHLACLTFYPVRKTTPPLNPGPSSRVFPFPERSPTTTTRSSAETYKPARLFNPHRCQFLFRQAKPSRFRCEQPPPRPSPSTTRRAACQKDSHARLSTIWVKSRPSTGPSTSSSARQARKLQKSNKANKKIKPANSSLPLVGTEALLPPRLHAPPVACVTSTALHLTFHSLPLDLTCLSHLHLPQRHRTASAPHQTRYRLRPVPTCFFCDRSPSCTQQDLSLPDQV